MRESGVYMDEKMKKVVYMVLGLFVLMIVLGLVLMQGPSKDNDKNDAELAQEALQTEQVITPEQIQQYKAEITKYAEAINQHKTQLNDNIQKLSNKKWLSHSYEDLVGITPEDMKILQENISIVYYLQSEYIGAASIKATKLKDKDGAREDLNEFKRIVKGNKYVVRNEDLLKIVDVLYKKWDL